MRIDCNIEAMSRKELEAAFFDVVDKLEGLTDTASGLSEKLQYSMRKELGKVRVNKRRFGTQQDSLILTALLSGNICTYNFIAEFCRRNVADDIISKGHVAVSIYCLRKGLILLGVEIQTIYGTGYKMDKKSINNLKALIHKYHPEEPPACT